MSTYPSVTIPRESIRRASNRRRLSNGILILGIAGIFWFMMAAWSADLTKGGPDLRMRSEIRLTFFWVGGVQILLCSLCVWLGLRFDRPDLIWPGVGLVVSLHFLPLARLFRVQLYYITAAVGAFVSLVPILTPEAALLPSMRLVLLGAGMGGTLWITAAYLIRNADKLAGVWEHAD